MVGKDAHTVKVSNMTDREKVIDHFKKTGKYDTYKKDGSLNARIKRGVAMIDEAERKKAWSTQQTDDDWATTKEKMSYYDDFIKEAERRLGRRLVITTAGSSLNHMLKKGEKDIGALDIGKKGNNLSDEEYDMLGKLAADFGYRIGDEADHLHVDDTKRVQEDKAREEVEEYYDKKEGSPELIEKGTKMAIEARKKLSSKNSKFIPSAQVFHNIPESGPKRQPRLERQRLQTFQKYRKKSQEFRQQTSKNMQDIVKKARQQKQQREINRDQRNRQRTLSILNRTLA